MTLDTIFAFLLGLLVGFLLAAYVLAPRKPLEQTSLNPQVFEQAVAQQIAFAQQQNMLRQLQLEQARQESEFRTLERQRIAYQSTFARIDS